MTGQTLTCMDKYRQERFLKVSEVLKILRINFLRTFRLKTIRDFMGFLVVKNEGARVVTTLFIDFSDAQGHLTPKTVM